MRPDECHLVWELRLFAVLCVAAGAWSASAGHWNDPTIGFAILVLVTYAVLAGMWLWRRWRRP